MKKALNFLTETGRSMLEVLAVIAVICTFTVGSIVIYNEANDKQKAKNDHEEILLAVSSNLNKGTARTNKGIADTLGDKKTTRRGNQIMTEKNCPEGEITVTVDQITPSVCKELLKKNWDTPQKPLSFYRAAEFGKLCSGLPSKITREGYYILSEADCERIKSSGEWITFSASYPMKANAVEPRLCKTDAECYGCETCSGTNVCVSTCDADQYCHSDGTCSEYEDCAENEYRDEKGECQKCPKDAVCADKRTIAGCQEGFYLEEGACIACPSPQRQGCLDDKDANGCPIYERMICRGTTPVCQSDPDAADYNTCHCPAHAICTGTSGGGSGSSGEGNTENTFACEEGWYRSGNKCLECHISGATDCSDEETATSCSENYYLSAGECISCPANATCAGGKADFVCGSGWEQNEAGTACVEKTECSGHGTKDENDACVCQGGYTGVICETDCSAYPNSGVGSDYTGDVVGNAADGTTECKCLTDTGWNGSKCTCEAMKWCPGEGCKSCDTSTGRWSIKPDDASCSISGRVTSTGTRCRLVAVDTSGFCWNGECIESTGMTKEQCLSYKKLWDEQMDRSGNLTGYCRTCSYENGVEATETECNNCATSSTPRVMLGKWCILSSKLATPCDGFRDSNGDCHSCSDSYGYSTSKDECDQCSDRVMDGYWCVLPTATCNTLYPTEGGFRDGYGNCRSCSTLDVIPTSKDECDQCSNREMMTTSNGDKCVLSTATCNALYPTEGGFRSGWGDCYSCSDTISSPTSKDECDKCSNREMMGNDCVLSTAACNALYPTEGGFRSNTGYCYSCSYTSSIYTSKDECDKCSNREMMTTSNGEKCVLSTAGCNAKYPTEGGFRDYIGHCHSCSDTSSIYTSKDECDKCATSSTPRMMDGEYCKLAPECFGHGTKTNGTCVCDAGYTGTNCQTEVVCSGHGALDENDTCVCQGGYTGTDCETQITCVNGTWSESGCTCTSGWYGPLCDSDCDGFKNNFGTCTPCSNIYNAVGTSADECTKCSSREIVTYDNRDACVLTASNCHLMGGFKADNGLCFSCLSESEFPASSAECASCDGTRYPRFMDNDGNCNLCSTFGTVDNTTVTECTKCSNREIFTYNGENLCALTAGACHDRSGFRALSGRCAPCSTNEMFYTSVSECAKCGSKRTYDASTGTCSKA